MRVLPLATNKTSERQKVASRQQRTQKKSRAEADAQTHARTLAHTHKSRTHTKTLTSEDKGGHAGWNGFRPLARIAGKGGGCSCACVCVCACLCARMCLFLRVFCAGASLLQSPSKMLELFGDVV